MDHVKFIYDIVHSYFAFLIFGLKLDVNLVGKPYIDVHGTERFIIVGVTIEIYFDSIDWRGSTGLFV
jgi:hypothetical protein